MHKYKEIHESRQPHTYIPYMHTRHNYILIMHVHVNGFSAESADCAHSVTWPNTTVDNIGAAGFFRNSWLVAWLYLLYICIRW